MKKMAMLSLAVALFIGMIACSNKLAEGPNSNTETTFMHLHGLGYSADGKRLFIPVHNGLKVYADGVWSDAPGEKHDYMGFSAADSDVSLSKINTQNNVPERIKTPTKDKITYIAQNPANSTELAIATEQKDVYLSTNSGAAWTQIADNGKMIIKKPS
ncbi:hypothetical protein [Cohnella massiliensis]|uniref:hypothetical protein n=1 Tax=Cohnella massiliensis TaxID=1816691 RepID=UPI0009B9E269|nr:hypothetical protein [Cohnella massiliensis]